MQEIHDLWSLSISGVGDTPGDCAGSLHTSAPCDSMECTPSARRLAHSRPTQLADRHPTSPSDQNGLQSLDLRKATLMRSLQTRLMRADVDEPVPMALLADEQPWQPPSEPLGNQPQPGLPRGTVCSAKAASSSPPAPAPATSAATSMLVSQGHGSSADGDRHRQRGQSVFEDTGCSGMAISPLQPPANLAN